MTDTQEQEEPSSMSPADSGSSGSFETSKNGHKERQNGSDNNGNSHRGKHSLLSRVQSLFKGKPDSTLREAIEEIIEGNESEDGTPVAFHEKVLITNVLKLRDLTVLDVMIPRADIVAIDINITQDDFFGLLASQQYSRIPVYRDKMDEIVGTIHIKDILSCLASGKGIKLDELIREVPIISPAMPVLDLLLMMKKVRKHMAMVVDEFGGIDGLVTIGDIIEAIVGEIDDEHDIDEDPKIVEKQDGSTFADGRVDIEEFEDKFGEILSDVERAEVDTVAGLIFSIEGRIPARGEIITHDSGMVFEIIDADPRRVHRVKIKNIPLPSENETL